MKHIVLEDKVGILLTNLGTPDAPTPTAVRKYLAEFLWDPRVVEFPRVVWWLILHGLILRFRPRKSAKLYQKIWTAEGSPLRVILDKQAKALSTLLGEKFYVIPAMRYGRPSISEAMEKFKAEKINKIFLFPLYPQYSATTTASTFDEFAKILTSWRWQPEIRTITGYHDNEKYIEGIAESIKNDWQENGQTEKLLFSFHGIPKRFFEKGDPYYCFCLKSARLIAERLSLHENQYAISFQSRLGKAQWLQPQTDQTLIKWGMQKVKSVSVICPGFSADCLETLEEIALLNKQHFISAGGKSYRYIPALNDSEKHIDIIADLIRQHTKGW